MMLQSWSVEPAQMVDQELSCCHSLLEEAMAQVKMVLIHTDVQANMCHKEQGTPFLYADES